MIYRVRHRTAYAYSAPVSLCQNLVHLEPRQAERQEVSSSRLEVSPVPTVCDRFLDYFGNPAAYFAIQEPHDRLVVVSEMTVEVAPRPELDLGASPAWEAVREAAAGSLEALPFTLASTHIAPSRELLEYASPSFAPGRPILEAARDLTRRIRADFRYDPQATNVATPLEEVVALRRGVCQDFAHLEIGCLRSLGLAARYVSGYLRTIAPPGRERLVGADASHAWASVFAGDGRWVDFDPTNDVIPSEGHVVVAWGRDFGDVTPLKGVILGGGEHAVDVAVEVSPVEAQSAAGGGAQG
jgi:transglutaminase-like putative cysteine protease